MNHMSARVRKKAETDTQLTAASNTECGSPLSQHMGRRLKELRLLKNCSQSKLGKALGVSFQQIQKYERGLNHINGDRLLAIAKALDVSINYFFEGFDEYEEHQGTRRRSAPDPLELYPGKTDQFYHLVGELARIQSPSIRTAILRLIKTMSDNEQNL